MKSTLKPRLSSHSHPGVDRILAFKEPRYSPLPSSSYYPCSIHCKIVLSSPDKECADGCRLKVPLQRAHARVYIKHVGPVAKDGAV